MRIVKTRLREMVPGLEVALSAAHTVPYLPRRSMPRGCSHPLTAWRRLHFSSIRALPPTPSRTQWLPTDRVAPFARQVYLDVDNLGGGKDHPHIDVSEVVLCFCTQNWLTNPPCVREIVRAVLRNKPVIALLEPETSDTRGGRTEAECRTTVHTAPGPPLWRSLLSNPH
jgi:hypothetical protein